MSLIFNKYWRVCFVIFLLLASFQSQASSSDLKGRVEKKRQLSEIFLFFERTGWQTRVDAVLEKIHIFDHTEEVRQ